MIPLPFASLSRCHAAAGPLSSTLRSLLTAKPCYKWPKRDSNGTCDSRDLCRFCTFFLVTLIITVVEPIAHVYHHISMRSAMFHHWHIKARHKKTEVKVRTVATYTVQPLCHLLILHQESQLPLSVAASSSPTYALSCPALETKEYMGTSNVQTTQNFTLIQHISTGSFHLVFHVSLVVLTSTFYLYGS